MPLGPKTRRYLETKRDPAGSVHDFMRGMEKMARGIAQDAIEGEVGAHKAMLDKKLAKAVDEALADFPVELRRALKAKLDSLPQLKGAAGYTPIKGEDYRDGQDGYTPVAGVDYPSPAQLRTTAAGYASALYERMRKEGLTKRELLKAVQTMFERELNWKRVARGLESLKGVERLDYEALKNRPGTPVEGPRHTLHRGGSSKQTYYYDLSDLCDGATKTFAIPTNTRVIWVGGTDAPAGRYRNDVDWTGSGTTLLTLTAQVVAPSRGATLDMLYVI